MSNNSPGLRLKTARNAAGFSQREFGARTGYAQAFISRIEKGLTAGTPEFWQAAAKALNASVAFFLDTGASANVTGYLSGREAILANDRTSPGLRSLANDPAAEAMAITDQEWNTLAVIPLSPYVTKNGYLQLLITLRAISDSEGQAES